MIVIVGVNGSGKFMIMDCFVFYIGLLSCVVLVGVGGFFYYDYVYLFESVKDLIWVYEGCCY